MVGNYQRDHSIELGSFPSPEQIEQAMPLFGDQNGHAFGAVGEADPPVHPVLASQGSKGGIELVPTQAETIALDLQSHEESGLRRVAHILVRTHDVSIV